MAAEVGRGRRRARSFSKLTNSLTLRLAPGRIQLDPTFPLDEYPKFREGLEGGTVLAKLDLSPASQRRKAQAAKTVLTKDPSSTEAPEAPMTMLNSTPAPAGEVQLAVLTGPRIPEDKTVYGALISVPKFKSVSPGTLKTLYSLFRLSEIESRELESLVLNFFMQRAKYQDSPPVVTFMPRRPAIRFDGGRPDIVLSTIPAHDDMEEINEIPRVMKDPANKWRYDNFLNNPAYFIGAHILRQKDHWSTYEKICDFVQFTLYLPGARPRGVRQRVKEYEEGFSQIKNALSIAGEYFEHGAFQGPVKENARPLEQSVFWIKPGQEFRFLDDADWRRPELKDLPFQKFSPEIKRQILGHLLIFPKCQFEFAKVEEKHKFVVRNGILEEGLVAFKPSEILEPVMLVCKEWFDLSASIFYGSNKFWLHAYQARKTMNNLGKARYKHISDVEFYLDADCRRQGASCEVLQRFLPIRHLHLDINETAVVAGRQHFSTRRNMHPDTYHGSGDLYDLVRNHNRNKVSLLTFSARSVGTAETMGRASQLPDSPSIMFPEE